MGAACPDFSTACKRCKRLARHLAGVRAEFPHYHARPVAAFGDPNPRLLIVGLAPGMHGANRTGRPFTGDYAGILLYETLHRFGFANQPEGSAPDDALRLVDCRITNAVKCLPPVNKPQPDEVKRCNTYLREELMALPQGAVVLALGGIAHGAVLMAEGLPRAAYRFGHGARHALSRDRVLYDSYHCSRYNTQTRRLTKNMFNQVLSDIISELAKPNKRHV
jgi:uracil-DNA glycosylase family 4